VLPTQSRGRPPPTRRPNPQGQPPHPPVKNQRRPPHPQTTTATTTTPIKQHSKQQAGI